MAPRLLADLPVFLVLAVVAGTAIYAALLGRERVPLVSTLGAYALAVAAALVGAKALSWVMDGPGVALRLNTGYRYPGAVVAALLAAPLVSRLLPRALGLARWSDLLVPGMAFALAILRLDCLLAGCCTGSISTLPWALRFARRSAAWYTQLGEGLIPFEASWTLPVHPLQLYLLALALCLGLGSLWLLGRRTCDGQVFLLFLLLHETGKGLLESLRHPHEPELQWSSLALGLASGLVLAARSIRQRRPALVRPVLP
jgi:phosphatidylglycerol:prolipoprotein diacylglycerol transferase